MELIFFPILGNYLLEQFQAQISAALRPAFTNTTNLDSTSPPSSSSPFSNLTAPLPDITAVACEVCACWLTSGVPREAADLRRVHDLLIASLEILRAPPSVTSSSASNALFSEACVTRLKLAVLTAWAEVFIASARSRKTALQALQLLSMLESRGRESGGGVGSARDALGDVVQRQFLLMLSRGDGSGSSCWALPSVTESSKLLEVLERSDEDEFADDQVDDVDDVDDSTNGDADGCNTDAHREFFAYF